MLVIVNCAHQIHRAAEQVLREVVAEAVARGAPWRSIGEQVGTGETGAQNRFGRGLDEARWRQLKDAAMPLYLVHASGLDQLPDELIRKDDTIGDTEPTETELLLDVNNAIMMILRVWQQVQKFFDQEDGLEFAPLESAYTILDDSCVILRKPASLNVLHRLARDDDQDFRIWEDTSTKTYFFDLVCKAHVALLELKATNAWRGDNIREFFLHIGAARVYLGEVIGIIARPQCMNVLAKLERGLADSGEPVFRHPNPEQLQGGVSLVELYRAFWRRDRTTLAAAIGIESMSDSLTLADVERLVSDAFDRGEASSNDDSGD
jgi:hypothetical protein